MKKNKKKTAGSIAGSKNSCTFATAIERESNKTNKMVRQFSWLEYMPVTHGVTGSSPVRTAINIGNQCFTNQTPDFTPKNVKSGVFVLFRKNADNGTELMLSRGAQEKDFITFVESLDIIL